jgi:hypothetical protein
MVNGDEWAYDYEVTAQWRGSGPAFVGTVVRTVTHSQGNAKARVVASFIAVRQ